MSRPVSYSPPASAGGGGAGAEVGAIRFTGDSLPTGWLECDGTAVSRTTYADLFGVISTTFGVGDGSTTFNLPDLRGRSPIGLGTGDATNATAWTEGEKGGDEVHLLDITESPVRADTNSTWSAGATGMHAGAFPGGGQSAHNTMHPVLGLRAIIRHSSAGTTTAVPEMVGFHATCTDDNQSIPASSSGDTLSAFEVVEWDTAGQDDTHDFHDAAGSATENPKCTIPASQNGEYFSFAAMIAFEPGDPVDGKAIQIWIRHYNSADALQNNLMISTHVHEAITGIQQNYHTGWTRPTAMATGDYVQVEVRHQDETQAVVMSKNNSHFYGRKVATP